MRRIETEFAAATADPAGASEERVGLVTPKSATRDALLRLGIDRGARIIEFDVETPVVARSLIAAGYCNYLGVARDSERLSELRAAAPETANLFQPMNCPSHFDQLRQNNADVVILSGDTPHYVHDALYLKHVSSVIWRPRGLWQLNASTFWASYKLVRGQIGPLKTVRFDCTSARGPIYWAVRRLQVRPGPPRRRFVDSVSSLPLVFQKLNEAHVRYVVLRWFEQFPAVKDVDMLVADQDWPTFRGIIDARPGIVPCDAYTPSALAGTEYHNVAYYPPHIANEILANRVRYTGGFYIPSPEHYFLSLAYHAVYHEGEESGLPFGNERIVNERQPEHRYRYEKKLSELAAQLGRRVELQLFALHQMLQERGWSPEVDTLRKLSRRNRWLVSILPDSAPDLETGELMVFVVREWATSRNLTTQIANWLEHQGLHIITMKELSPVEQRLATRLRGGVWEDGAVDIGRPSGGNPMAIIVAFDWHPEPPTAEDLANYPHVKNAHVFLKRRLRGVFQPHVPPERLVSFIHSADDECEAWDYLRLACPDVLQDLRVRVAELRETLSQSS